MCGEEGWGWGEEGVRGLGGGGCEQSTKEQLNTVKIQRAGECVSVWGGGVGVGRGGGERVGRREDNEQSPHNSFGVTLE